MEFKNNNWEQLRSKKIVFLLKSLEIRDILTAFNS